MKRTIWILASIVVALSIVLIAPRLLEANRTIASNESPSADQSQTTPMTSASPQATSKNASSIAGKWNVSVPSEAGYQLDEVLGGANVTVVGKTSNVTGEVQVGENALESANIQVDMASIATDNSNRDDFFRETLKTQDFPQATVEVKQKVDLPALAANTSETVTVPASVTIGGVARDISVPMTLSSTESGLDVKGSVPITFADFNVEAPNLGFVQVEDHGSIEFSLHLVKG